MSTRKLTNEDINRIVARKGALFMDAGTRVRKVARLREELQVAIEQANIKQIESLNKQIADLSKDGDAHKPKANALSDMNKINMRNKKTNEQSIRRAEKLNVANRQKQLLNNSFNDPFSRLRTNPKIFYSSDASHGNADDAGKSGEDKEGDGEKKDPVKELANCLYRRDGIDAVIKQINFDIELQI
ncbi:unnamed protein product [Ambrosiozyma monospora]|uniref:Unnamed protein product n=1 Tax=Ambrosiozyma monospora TaxID=43982 RepID=A0ACB5T784_AMBMO|nr:unnamed protein product [Ambrosiozyma monospora]